MVVHTVGHSTRELADFLSLVRAHGIRRVVEGIDYRHEPDLGGRRTERSDSPHTAWRSPSFRAYADHMDTPSFGAALARLVELGREASTAILCAEAVPWRCHRQLIADALVARGVEVRHILGAGPAEPYALHLSAEVREGGRLVYAGPPALFPP